MTVVTVVTVVTKFKKKKNVITKKLTLSKKMRIFFIKKIMKNHLLFKSFVITKLKQIFFDGKEIDVFGK